MPTPRKYATRAERDAAYRQRQSLALRALQTEKGLPPLPPIPTIPGKKRWYAALDMAQALVQQVADEMEAYESERSDRWRESDAASDHEGWQQDVAEALAALEAAQDKP